MVPGRRQGGTPFFLLGEPHKHDVGLTCVCENHEETMTRRSKRGRESEGMIERERVFVYEGERERGRVLEEKRERVGRFMTSLKTVQKRKKKRERKKSKKN